MANDNQKSETPAKTIGERPHFVVKVFPDEYEDLDLSPDLSLFEAQTLVRSALGVAVPMRRGSSASLSALTTAIRGTSPEKREEIMRILSEREEGTNDGDEDDTEDDESSTDEDEE